jgi:hypothetical protein
LVCKKGYDDKSEAVEVVPEIEARDPCGGKILPEWGEKESL